MKKFMVQWIHTGTETVTEQVISGDWWELYQFSTTHEVITWREI